MLETYLLEYLLAFDECGNLSTASKKLNVSQPSLTRAMQKLENELGTTLFLRTGNKIEVNDVGRMVVNHAKIVIECIKNLETEVQDYINSKQTLSIGYVAPGPMFKFISKIYTTFPNKKIITELKDEESLINGLQNRTYDFIFLNREIINKNFVCTKCMEENLYIAVPNSHFVADLKSGVYFKDIDRQSFLMSSSVGVWDKIVREKLPHSKFLLQKDENLVEVANSSSLPTFATDVSNKSGRYYNNTRINIPILDNEAKMTFYFVCLNENANRFKKII